MACALYSSCIDFFYGSFIVLIGACHSHWSLWTVVLWQGSIQRFFIYVPEKKKKKKRRKGKKNSIWVWNIMRICNMRRYLFFFFQVRHFNKNSVIPFTTTSNCISLSLPLSLTHSLPHTVFPLFFKLSLFLSDTFSISCHGNRVQQPHYVEGLPHKMMQA